VTDQAVLTIAIPTYNRASYLERLLGRISDCDLTSISILVLDNHSTDNTGEVVRGFAEGKLKERLIYRANTANIGGDANIARCFEASDSEWVWVLGDDDLPVEGCTEIIMRAIQANKDCIYIEFGSSILNLRTKRGQTYHTVGLAGFIEGFDCYSNLLFISSGVYNRNTLVRVLDKAYLYTYSHSSQIAILLLYLSQFPGRCCFSSEFLIEWEPPAPQHAWDNVMFTNRSPLIVEAIPANHLRCLMIDKMRKVEEIAPALTLRRLNEWKVSREKHLRQFQSRYFLLAALTGKYGREASICGLLLRVSNGAGFGILLRIVSRLGRSRISLVRRIAASVLDRDLLCKDARVLQ
jgi:glycosyltransferase involved in cell wall biosynthesis